MSTLKVTPGQLEGLGGTTHRSCAEVRATHQRLHAQLAPLFGADWSGAAAAHSSQRDCATTTFAPL